MGVRYNCENGGPAPEKLTNAIYEHTTTISKYYAAEGLPGVDVGHPGRHTFMVQHADDKKFAPFVVEVGRLACHVAAAALFFYCPFLGCRDRIPERPSCATG